ncbi:hypothetical protein [Maioricimonas sp. JC845]|uniref:hypothetical protein n=1 Tax=Maioricimonas sp. JC845 TaxID=3232138 RepID=UPI003459CC58
MIENYRWLAGVIAAHRHGRVAGRTRLQKEIKLLQRLGLPTRYRYTIHFYGPYSEGLHAELRMLESMELVTESEATNAHGKSYYVIQAKEGTELKEVERFQPFIEQLEDTDAVVLELAATYDAFRQMGDDHERARTRLRRKKGTKCNEGREEQALQLLVDLGLSSTCETSSAN